jgi:hypothetical protein
METKRKDTTLKKSNNNRFFTSFPFIAISVIIIAALLFFVWHQKTLEEKAQQQEIFSQNLSDTIAVPEQVSNETNHTSSTESSAQPEKQKDTAIDVDDGAAQNEAVNPPEDIEKADDNNTVSTLSEDSQPKTDTSASLEQKEQDKPIQSIRCQNTTKFIEDFFKHLDQQQYLKKYNIEPDSKTYFIALMQKTLDNPPVVSGETDDLYTILQNTAHFFRIIGNTNIALLKNILSNEKAQFENIAAEFYTLVTSQACAEQSFGLKISKPSLYEYAGFFLNTMGGRLYLFRRDSISRMVISYYSILLIDRANIESYNKHGIELSTSIDLLISEMESTTNTLKLKETYLNTLYALQEQYQ